MSSYKEEMACISEACRLKDENALLGKVDSGGFALCLDSTEGQAKG